MCSLTTVRKSAAEVARPSPAAYRPTASQTRFDFRPDHLATIEIPLRIDARLAGSPFETSQLRGAVLRCMTSSAERHCRRPQQRPDLRCSLPNERSLRRGSLLSTVMELPKIQWRARAGQYNSWDLNTFGVPLHDFRVGLAQVYAKHA